MPTPVPPSQVIEALQWRYATRKFDPAKKIPAADWSVLEQALVLAPSSIGLQPWRFFVITDQVMRERLWPAAWKQVQVIDCSHFVVFTVRLDLGAEHVDKHIARMVEIRGGTVESLAGFRKMAVGNLDQARAAGRLDTWQMHQLYIALGQFMTAAAVMGIDTCPMEGFEPAKFDEILGLKASGYGSVVCCAAGYRLPDDKFANLKKVRFKPEDVIERI
ncbi:MAG: NAD(P)H-dependent oxidoreductase [Opitutaceae bacterium]|nr:NAD(P)H-dependent oxidoreductase [Opitutaceae bacterium]